MSEEQNAERTLSLGELFDVLWNRRWLILLATLAISTVGLIVIVLLPNVYRSQAVYAPNSDSQDGVMGRLMSDYGGVLGLAGVNLGSTSASETAVGLAILKSNAFLGEFVNSHDLLVPLFAAKDWDHKTDALQLDSRIFDEESNIWTRKVAPPRTPKPSTLEAAEAFRELLKVREDKDTGLVSISLDFYSPQLAQQWLTWLVSDLNQGIRARDVDEAERAINYLQQQALATSISDIRTVFYGLVEDQVKKAMLANITEEYFLRTVDPPTLPREKLSPKRILLAIVVFLFAIMSSSLYALIASGRSATVA